MEMARNGAFSAWEARILENAIVILSLWLQVLVSKIQRLKFADHGALVLTDICHIFLGGSHAVRVRHRGQAATGGQRAALWGVSFRRVEKPRAPERAGWALASTRERQERAKKSWAWF